MLITLGVIKKKEDVNVKTEKWNMALMFWNNYSCPKLTFGIKKLNKCIINQNFYLLYDHAVRRLRHAVEVIKKGK